MKHIRLLGIPLFYAALKKTEHGLLHEAQLIEGDWLGYLYHVTNYVIQPCFEGSRGSLPASDLNRLLGIYRMYTKPAFEISI